jgi:hypothetical protein
MADTRRPIHLGIAVGISASLYALSLAAVTGLQSHQNAQTSDAYAPLSQAIDRLDSADSDLEARLDAAHSAFGVSATAFSDVADKVPDLEASLKSLAGTVTKIHGTSISMPTAVSIPRVSSSGGGSAPKPAVHTTTSASGH